MYTKRRKEVIKMANKEEIKKVLNYIEENMRVTEQTSIEYLDSQGHIDRLCLKQNHIVFGRRGSGKSLLLKSLKEQNKAFCITVNLEDFKDISFPNSIIQVQKAIMKQLLPILKDVNSFFSITYWKTSRPLLKRLNKQIAVLNTQLEHPDEYDKSIKQKKVGRNMQKVRVKQVEMNLKLGPKLQKKLKQQKKLKLIS